MNNTRKRDTFYKGFLSENRSLANESTLIHKKQQENWSKFIKNTETRRAKANNTMKKHTMEAESNLLEAQQLINKSKAESQRYSNERIAKLFKLPKAEALKEIDEDIALFKKSLEDTKKAIQNSKALEEKYTEESLNRNANVVLKSFAPNNKNRNTHLQAELNKIKQTRKGIGQQFNQQKRNRKAQFNRLNASTAYEIKRLTNAKKVIEKLPDGGRRTRRRRA